MATSEPLYLEVAEEWAVHERLWDRAKSPDSPGGREIVPVEIAKIDEHRRTKLYRIPVLTATVEAMTSLGRSRDGIDGKRVERNFRERWASRKDNVIPFPEMGGGEAA